MNESKGCRINGRNEPRTRHSAALKLAAGAVLFFSLTHTHAVAGEGPVRLILGKPPKILLVQDDAITAYSLPADIRIGVDKRRDPVLMRSGKEVDRKELAPARAISFGRPVNVFPKGGVDRFLVCTDALLPGTKGRDYDDFCGIVSVEGKVLFRFPVKQERPKSLLKPTGMTPDGLHAEVVVGEEAAGEDRPQITKPREILVWDFPDKLQRLPGPWAKGAPKSPSLDWSDVRRGFQERSRKK